jgi:GTP-binding protein
MKITQSVFVKSGTKREHFPKDGLPEIAFSGRSNVGKSSMLNCLLQRRNLARTSSTPGHTRLVNFFLVNDSFYLVDLPGYGYAKVSVDMRRDWKRMVEEYLEDRPQLKLMILIIDLRRGLEDDERDFLSWLKEKKIPALVVATKVDKLKRGERIKAGEENVQGLSPLGMEAIEFSSESGEGREEVLSRISKALR